MERNCFFGNSGRCRHNIELFARPDDDYDDDYDVDGGGGDDQECDNKSWHQKQQMFGKPFEFDHESFHCLDHIVR